MNSIVYLSCGLFLGLAAGLAPGPLLTLVITETLKHNKKEGIKVSCAPLLTDIPIVLLSIFILAKISNSHLILGIISIIGGLFILYLGYENIRFQGIKDTQEKEIPKSIQKGIITNFLNPHPYLFWLTVGAPMVVKSYSISPVYPILFLIGFYLSLVGSKILVAFLIEKSKSFLQNKIYIYSVRVLGIGLILFAIIFFKDGYHFLNQ